VAVTRAEVEFAKYRALEDAQPSLVEKQLEDAMKKLKQLKPGKRKKGQ